MAKKSEKKNLSIQTVRPKVWNFKVVDGKDAWKEVVYSARVSGVPPSVKDKEVFEMIVKNYYGSTLEHIIIKFDMKITKGIAPEFLEHRMVSHTGYSTRYRKASERVDKEDQAFEVILPLHLTKDSSNQERELIIDEIKSSVRSYEKLIEKGVPREIARYILPFGQAVGIYHVTLNLRSLLNLLGLRLCVRAAPEFRSVASQLYFKLLEELPPMKGLVGCRGFMRRVCPEGGVTGVRKGKQHSFYPPCLFKSPDSSIYIPTNQEIEKGAKRKPFNREKATKAQETIFRKWATWK